jgi:hypothetical protein
VRIDIGYDAAKLFNPSAQIAKSAAALDKSIQGNIFSPGIYRVLIMDTRPPAASTTKLTPLPDGDIAYLTFTIPFSSSAGIVPLTIASGSGYSATDLGAADMTVNDGVSGLVNIVTKPGNSIGADPALGTNVDVALKHVMDAYYMLLNPDVSVNPLVPFDPVSNQLAHPIDGAADLNADGVVQIYEFQQVINSLLGIE